MIKRILALTILALTPTLCEAGDVVIQNRPGGILGTVFSDVRQAIINGDHVILKGNIFSAATMWTSVPNVCAMPGTTLGFHRGTYLLTGGPPPEDARLFYVRNHPASLQQVIVGYGLLSNPN